MKKIYKEILFIALCLLMITFFTILVLGTIPLQLEKGFEKYCKQNNGVVIKIENVTCRTYKDYCGWYCSSNNVNMQDWYDNVGIIPEECKLNQC